eukprot:gene4347-4926_t
MPDKIAPKAHRNKLHGYKLWKEGYISNVEVKSNVLTDNLTLFLVKSNVSASMKSMKYVVYCHLNQKTGDVIHAKCNCKAGAGGCCKHVAALLYTLLDYSNLELSYVPETVTCTQVLQKWSVPGKKLDSSVAVKFNDLVFEKSNFTRDKCMTRKKPPVNGSRDNYCATPMFARTISRDTIRNMADALEKAGQATLLAQTLKGNDCIASSFYFSSINPCQKMVSEEIPNEPSPINEPERLDIFMKMSATFDDRLIPNESTKETIAQNVCISLSKARRKNIHPKSIIDAVIKKNSSRKVNPPSIQWGLDKEKVALQQYVNERLEKNQQIMNAGLIINPTWPWLGASPDGIVMEAGKIVGAIEIKCPFTKKDFCINEAATMRDFFMIMNENGKPALKQNHGYFFQCQGVMNIAQLKWIDFAVYTEKELFVERIACDVSLWHNRMLPELTDFYINYIVEHL